jgi:Holliday junction resolvase RusA-like endonuclease
MKNRQESKLVVYGEFPDLNTEIAKTKRHWSGYAKSKQETTNLALIQLKGKKPFITPCRVKFIWFTPNIRKDPDNVCFAKKYILDALVRAGIIPDDTRKEILGFVDDFDVDAKNPRVEIYEC